MGAELKTQTWLHYTTTTCITCGIEICLPNALYMQRHRDHKIYYCPNGHSQHFIDETEEEKLKKELDAQKRRTEMALADARHETARRERAEKKLKRAARRVHNGVCPHCSIVAGPLPISRGTCKRNTGLTNRQRKSKLSALQGVNDGTRT